MLRLSWFGILCDIFFYYRCFNVRAERELHPRWMFQKEYVFSGLILIHFQLPISIENLWSCVLNLKKKKKHVFFLKTKWPICYQVIFKFKFMIAQSIVTSFTKFFNSSVSVVKKISYFLSYRDLKPLKIWKMVTYSHVV